MDIWGTDVQFSGLKVESPGPKIINPSDGYHHKVHVSAKKFSAYYIMYVHIKAKLLNFHAFCWFSLLPVNKFIKVELIK